MAATFTSITLTEVDTFLKRGFRILRPKPGQDRGEHYYDLGLSPFVMIRVWTSVPARSEIGAPQGADAIRVQLLNAKTKRPLQSGKAPIVKRTQNWRNSLQDQIEKLIEAYEGDEVQRASWDREPTPEEQKRGPGPTTKQVNYLIFLLNKASHHSVWEEITEDYGLTKPISKKQIEDKLTGGRDGTASKVIDKLLAAGVGGSRYASDDDWDEERVIPDVWN
jgi:hypothetical protein